MSRPIRLDPEARDELREAARWYEARQVGLGLRFLERIDEALRRAAMLGPECHPVAGVSPELGVRRILVRGFSYIVYIVELPKAVRVLAIAHEHRKPGYWRRRL